jgi:hypothetical protein
VNELLEKLSFKEKEIAILQEKLNHLSEPSEGDRSQSMNLLQELQDQAKLVEELTSRAKSFEDESQQWKSQYDEKCLECSSMVQQLGQFRFFTSFNIFLVLKDTKFGTKQERMIESQQERIAELWEENERNQEQLSQKKEELMALREEVAEFVKEKEEWISDMRR